MLTLFIMKIKIYKSPRIYDHCKSAGNLDTFIFWLISSIGGLHHMNQIIGKSPS